MAIHSIGSISNRRSHYTGHQFFMRRTLCTCLLTQCASSSGSVIRRRCRYGRMTLCPRTRSLGRRGWLLPFVRTECLFLATWQERVGVPVPSGGFAVPRDFEFICFGNAYAKTGLGLSRVHVDKVFDPSHDAILIMCRPLCLWCCDIMINVSVHQDVVFCVGSECAIRHDIHIVRHLMSEVQHGSLVGTQGYHEVLSTRFLVLVSVVMSVQNSCLHGDLVIS